MTRCWWWLPVVGALGRARTTRLDGDVPSRWLDQWQRPACLARGASRGATEHMLWLP